MPSRSSHSTRAGRSSRPNASGALLTVLVLATGTLAGCGGGPTPPAVRQGPTDVGTVHLPTVSAPTTDSSGHRIEALPAPPAAAMSGSRVRGLDYSYSLPVGWSAADRDLEPPPDTVVLPDDTDVSALIAVQRPFPAGSHTLREAVDRLRASFAAKGFDPKAAPERDIAGYHAQGIVVDEAPDLRHLFYVVVYTDLVFAVRLTYDPSTPDPLGAFAGVLDSWTWG
jgi:hypothetical protein